MSWLKKGRAATDSDASKASTPGRDEPMQVENRHFVSGNPIQPPFPQGLQTAVFAMGCFWGAERVFWQRPGVFSTAVGYIAGLSMNPS